MINKQDTKITFPVFIILGISIILFVMGVNQKKMDNQQNLVKIKQDIINYLVNEANERPEVAERVCNDLAEYQDTLIEYHTWLKTKRYPEENEGAVVVRGYTARKLAELARGKLTPFSVYSTLNYLRSDPEAALKFIERGFIYE